MGLEPFGRTEQLRENSPWHAVLDDGTQKTEKPHMMKVVVNPMRCFMEGVVQAVIRRQVIHGKERNGEIESNFSTTEYDTSTQAS
ncbi:hypothetical protein KDN24_00135 [Bacillus sp. Bva_UNVM-123]|uniref:hypothetical protein n=1 Tax=Bacillus sp. Bva_UNVM-123 TaxID=2829798 RepID=UPI00391F22D3